MAGVGGPTLAEVVRRLDEVVSQLAALTARLDSTYLRRDVYEAQRGMERVADESRDRRLDQIEDDKTWFRRAVVIGIAFPILLTVFDAVLLVVKTG